MSDALSDRKAALRKAAFARRKTAHAATPDAGQRAAEHLLASRFLTGAAVVSAYCPIRTEIDPMPLMRRLSAAGHRICVPVIQGEGLALQFREWHPDVAMEEGPFGAAVPVGTDWLAPDLVIAPLVAFDREGGRLGYGGGFYDRSLEEMRRVKPTLAIGYAFAAQEVPDLPREPTDQPLDAIVTEEGMIPVRSPASDPPA
ncbi:MAG: 5-formyltetrahydrofolate cyclo-ligase [Pseudomonadota bacterium]